MAKKTKDHDRDDGLVHVPPDRDDDAAEVVAAAIERTMREMNPDMAPDAALCTGCLLIVASGAVEKLLKRYAPEPVIPRNMIVDLLEVIGRATRDRGARQ